MKQARYNHEELEKRWQNHWREERLYEVEMDAADKREKFYNLMMFPYPSAEGLHVGNMYAFTGADVYGRYQRLKGRQVLEPIGLDGFGIHSENYALKIGVHPWDQAKKSEERFYEQLTQIGNGFAWENRLETYDPEYYRWTQWLFVQMFKRGLAYRARALVNWCPSCKTVLADEQVEAGLCERCKSEVEKKEMASWYFRITEYADRLLSNLDGSEGPDGKFGPVSSDYEVRKEGLRWPNKIKTAQRNWIGKKTGAEVEFEVRGKGLKTSLACFTTRLDTVYGVTFVVVAPEVVADWVKQGFKASDPVSEYVQQALNKSDQQRQIEEKEKTGVDTGVVAVNPVNGEEVAVYVADYVLAGFGTGAVMGVPAHDERDLEFAKKYGLEVRRVVQAEDSGVPEIDCFSDDGVVVNSGKFDGLKSEVARVEIQKEFAGKIKLSESYHLRDWLISRQRYWGPPIPMVFCQVCADKERSWFDNNEASEVESKDRLEGWWPVAEDELPVLLPRLEEYKPTGDGRAPLANADEDWLVTKCPECASKATREVDVSDTFLDSSWYFLRYPSLKAESRGKQPFDPEITKQWLPVDAYIGGAEHAVLHLLYARFVTMVLHDMGRLSFEEPFPFLFGHGLIVKDGAKMSKSRGNVVNPDEYIVKYGADVLRSYLMFLGPYDQGGDFRDTGIAGMKRFLGRVWDLYHDSGKCGEKTTSELLRAVQKTIKRVSTDMERFSFNTGIAALMELVNAWKEDGAVMSAADRARVLVLLAPYAPHVTEELYQKLELTTKAKSVHVETWPTWDEELVQEEMVEIPVQVNGKLRGKVVVGREELADAEVEARVMELAKSEELVAKWLEGKKVIKEIWVPGKLVNLVVKD